jgi:hypothetical protein
MFILRCLYVASIRWRQNLTRPVTGSKRASKLPCLRTCISLEWVFFTI